MAHSWLKSLVIAVFIVCVLATPEASRSSRPVRAAIIGCVADGLFISWVVTLETLEGMKTFRGFNFLRVKGVDLKQYEGQTLMLTGFLHPGDLFVVSRNDLELIALSCYAAPSPEFQKTLAWAYRSLARDKSSQKDYEDALRYINRAIAIDSTECEFFMTRSEIYQAQGQWDSAREDEKQAGLFGCGR